MTNPDVTPAFPFDILLLGGDDLVMVTPASVAIPVAQAIAKSFYREANKERDAASGDAKTGGDVEPHSLSLGVVLAPIKYPFNLLLELAQDTLKFAKKAGSAVAADQQSAYGKTRLNFMVVTGSISQG